MATKPKPYSLTFAIHDTQYPIHNTQYQLITPFNHFTIIMQNKANLLYSQMNVSVFSKMAYENKYNWTLGENKPNSNPISKPRTRTKPAPTQKNPVKFFRAICDIHS